FSHVTPPTAIFSLSLHDALPISPPFLPVVAQASPTGAKLSGTVMRFRQLDAAHQKTPLTASSPPLPFVPGRRWPDLVQSAPASADRKSTRLNSSHVKISYAVFCL